MYVYVNYPSLVFILQISFGKEEDKRRPRKNFRSQKLDNTDTLQEFYYYLKKTINVEEVLALTILQRCSLDFNHAKDACRSHV